MTTRNTQRLQEISAEIERLGRAGKLTRETFKPLWDEAIEAAGDQGADVLGGLWTWAVYCGLPDDA